MLRGPAGLVYSVGDGISTVSPSRIASPFGCDRVVTSLRGTLNCVNRSASASTDVPSISPFIVFGRPCKACGFGCTTGLDAGV